ncbi:MAG: hypothetical protein EWV85_07975 [Microcystis aeruginosa Ma_QC_C_20070703_M131]|uniref:Uncharacterized protein n=1 Tax=Microcystis aeruginosa Ma_QC_C_20070703_M131 TaxID=2486263 RepID=A0A551Y6H7_MICAE|nr:MAG: hypothetical protein EWV85_07975 [Microcystis aeruginosa Ma_QC_C_20070703_M131]
MRGRCQRGEKGEGSGYLKIKITGKGTADRIENRFIVISIKIENINPRVHKGFVGLECIRLI